MTRLALSFLKCTRATHLPYSAPSDNQVQQMAPWVISVASQHLPSFVIKLTVSFWSERLESCLRTVTPPRCSDIYIALTQSRVNFLSDAVQLRKARGTSCKNTFSIPPQNYQKKASEQIGRRGQLPLCASFQSCKPQPGPPKPGFHLGAAPKGTGPFSGGEIFVHVSWWGRFADYNFCAATLPGQVWTEICEQ